MAYGSYFWANGTRYFVNGIFKLIGLLAAGSDDNCLGNE